MADNKKLSPIELAKQRMQEADRQRAQTLAKLIPEKGQGGMTEADAKRIAAALMEMMNR